MKCYIITFETNSEESRSKFTTHFKTNFTAYCPITKYCWAVLTDKKATEIRDALSTIAEPNERIFVVRSGTEAAWINSFGTAHNDWLKKNL